MSTTTITDEPELSNLQRYVMQLAKAVACPFCGERMEHMVTKEGRGWTDRHYKEFKKVENVSLREWTYISYPKMHCNKCHSFTSIWEWNTKSMQAVIEKLHDFKKGRPWRKRLLITNGNFSKYFWKLWSQSSMIRAGSEPISKHDRKKLNLLEDQTVKVHHKFMILFPNLNVRKSKKTGLWYIYFNE